MTIQHESGGTLTTFLDKIWVQLFATTGITILWLFWIIYEILIKEAPA